MQIYNFSKRKFISNVLLSNIFSFVFLNRQILGGKIYLKSSACYFIFHALHTLQQVLIIPVRMVYSAKAGRGSLT